MITEPNTATFSSNLTFNRTIIIIMSNPTPVTEKTAFHRAPETPTETVEPVYWSHRCKNAGINSGGVHIQRLPKSKPLNYDVVCKLGCGQQIGRTSELLNKRYEVIGLGGGKNVMVARLARWWMECGQCKDTYKNFLEDHPAVKVLAENCHSCGSRFTSEAITRNLYGEDQRWVLESDKAYEGYLVPTVAMPPLGLLEDTERIRREWFKL